MQVGRLVRVFFPPPPPHPPFHLDYFSTFTPPLHPFPPYLCSVVREKVPPPPVLIVRGHS